MPAKSSAQKRLMDAAAHNPAFAKKVGIPSKVAKEFSKESKGMTFQKGGEVKKDSKAMAKKEIAFMQKKGAPKSMIKHEKEEYGMKSGGKAYAAGGRASTARGVASNKPIDFSKVTPAGMGKGPINPSAMKQTRPTMSGRMSTMKSGGLAAGHKAADGVAKKGRTSTTMVKMMRGGKAC